MKRKEAKKDLEEEFGIDEVIELIDGVNSKFLKINKKGIVTGVDVDAFVDHLLEKYQFKTIYSSKFESVYFYKNGIWNKTGRQKIKTETETLLKEHSKNNVVNEIFEKTKRKTGIDWDEFNKIPEGLICVENGVVNLKTGEVNDFSPDHYFKTKIPITYDKNADCPVCKKFFSEALYEEDVPLMQEWFGFNLYNKYFEKKAVILFGDKDTGKTAIAILLSRFLGENNIVGLSLQKVTHGKFFDLMNLKDKYANIYDDLGSKDLSDTGGFKIASGGGNVTGEEKFGDIHRIRTFAKHTFTANKIPPIKHVDDPAYWSRWMPIALDNQVDEKDQDKFLEKKLTTKEELSGLLNWAIEGLQRLIKNNGFSFKKSLQEVKQIMQRSSHPLNAFGEDCLEKKDGNKITKREMFAVYTDWCEKKEIARMTIEQLGRQLERFVPYILDAKDSKGRHWLNAVFKKGIKIPVEPVISDYPVKPKPVSIPPVKDTKDTISTFTRDYEENGNNNIKDKSLKKVSFVSQEEQENKDIDFNKSGIKEELEG